MERQIIRIDEEKCNGCGLCCQGCPEGALQLIDGKARLVSEITCDGLGACIGTCPVGAIQVEVREAAPYDERATLDYLMPQGTNTLAAHLRHLHEHGQTTYLQQAIDYLTYLGVPVPAYRKEKQQGHACNCSQGVTYESAEAADPVLRSNMKSQLGQWPVQMHLISPMNPVFEKADLLLAADCVAFAMADFNQRCLPGKRLAVACPKLDQNQQVYVDKLVALMDEAEINTLTVMIMEVPCCGGLLRLAQTAAQQAKRKVPIKVVVVGVNGEIKKESWAI